MKLKQQKPAVQPTTKYSNSSDVDATPKGTKKISFSSLVTQVNQKSQETTFSKLTGFCTNKLYSLGNCVNNLCSFLTAKEEDLLEPQAPSDKGRKTLVLDLDETLVHSQFVQNGYSDFAVKVRFEGSSPKVYVVVRPGVQEFLREMSKIYELVLFTASVSEYANPVIDKIDPEGFIKYRLYRQHCRHHFGAYVKDLSRLGRNLKDVIIVDNSEIAFTLHRSNAFHITNYYTGTKDKELYKLIPFLKYMAKKDDVRSIEEWRVKYRSQALNSKLSIKQKENMKSSTSCLLSSTKDKCSAKEEEELYTESFTQVDDEEEDQIEILDDEEDQGNQVLEEQVSTKLT